METHKLSGCCNLALLTPKMTPECESIAQSIETKVEQKEKFEAMACLEECHIKSIGGLDDDGNIKKEVIMTSMAELMKEHPEFIESSKNSTEMCTEKG